MARGSGLLILALGLGAGATAQAQDPARIFGALEGAWAGEGTLFGAPARFDMRWASVPGMAILTFANRTVDDAGQTTPVLGAVAIYRTSPATPRATWEDTRGVQIHVAWTATDSTLVSEWTAPSESGRTTYSALPDGTVEVVDEVRRDGSLVMFGYATYRRVAP